MARPEGSPTPSSPPSSPDRFPRLSRRSLLKGAAGAVGVAVANELTGRPLLPSGAEAHEVIPRDPQLGSEPVALARPTSPLDKIIQKGAEVAQSGIGAIRKELAVLAGKPAAAHGLDEKNTKSNRATVTERRVMELRPSSVINNVETFGHEQALSDTEMRQLIENLNAKVSALSPEERAATMRNDTYYGTMFISETAYGAFFTDNSETFQTFLKRHEIEMRRMLKDGRPSIVPDMIDERTDTRGFQIRRVVVLKDNVAPPASYHSGYLDNGINDSDGTFIIPHDNLLSAVVNGHYIASGAPNYNREKRIDYGFLHELGHTILKWADLYGVNVPSTSIPDSIKNRLPPLWRSYSGADRPDLSKGDLMSAAGDKIGSYNSLQTVRRNNPHNFLEVLRDYQGFPSEIPQRVSIRFTLNNGQIIHPTMVEIYRTKGKETGNPHDKDLMQTPIYTGILTNFNPNNIFEKNNSGLIPITDATLLVKMNANGKEYFRWMDVRDFNLAHWTTGNAGVATMDMKVIASDDTTTTPESFDWTIRSSTKRSLVPVIPRLFAGLNN